MPITVVKCGGAVDPTLTCADVAALRASGERVVLVHGGAGDIAAVADSLGVQRRTLRSPSGITSRYTDPAMLDAMVLAMTGRAKPRLLAGLAAVGVPAVGLTGLDAGLLRAVRKGARRSVENGRTRLVRDDQSGRITAVDPKVLRVLLANGFTPVVSPPAAGPDGAPLNVDADRVAAAIAVALRAERLVLLTAAPGVLRDHTDESSVLPRYELSTDSGNPDSDNGPAASAGMYRKLVAAREALAGGVPAVRVADGRVPGPLTAALSGHGTSIELGEPAAEQEAS